VVAAKGFDDSRQFWDQRFASEEYVFGTAPNVFLASQSQWFKPGIRVLDVACGEGRNAVWLAQQGCEVVAIDISPVAIEKARRLAAERRVHVAFELVDVRNWRWPPSAFDAVVSVFIQFAAPAERAQLFTGFVTTLRPDGVLVLQGYTPKQLQYKTGGPPQVEHMYTQAMLREAVAGLEIVHVREHDDVLSEGTKHVGLSALIDLVARKPG
jgi:cyclopropane fatty-acyl-phospholipid synthase-like methyltransferase